MYLVTCTHPNFTFCISYLSQFSSRPLDIHHTAVKRVFHYISSTLSYVLVHPQSSSVKLEGFSNASFANCIDTHHFNTSYIFQLRKCTISLYYKKQQCISNSTTKVEYIALSITARQAKWYTHAFKQININIPVQLYNDPQSSIKLIENPVYYHKTKYIDIVYYYTRSCLINNLFQLTYVSTKTMLVLL